MKTRFVRFWWAAAMLAAMPAGAGTRDVGNGGDAVSQEFAALVRQLARDMAVVPQLQARGLDQQIEGVLRTTYITSQERVFLAGPSGEQIERDALNFPRMTPPTIIVSRTRWSAPEMTSNRKRALALHEVLGVLEIEQNRYDASAEILNLLELDPTTPRKLYELTMGEGSEGYTFQSVMKACAQQKALNRHKYWEVTCQFRSKNWSEIHWDVEWAKDYEFQGFSARSVGVGVSLYGVYVHPSASNEERVRYVEVPHEVRRTIEKAVYGLEVYGIGPMDQLSWKRVTTSMDLANGIAPVSFSSEDEALDQCWEDLVDLASDFGAGILYRKGRCLSEVRIIRGQERFIYVIESQNPFLK